MLELANEGFILSTDLADYLVKKYNIPFRKAYLITAKIVNYAESKNLQFNDLLMKDLNKIDKNLDEDVLEVFEFKKLNKIKKILWRYFF